VHNDCFHRRELFFSDCDFSYRAHPKPSVDSDEPRMKEQVPRFCVTLEYN
jgi:hypothetical protein